MQWKSVLLGAVIATAAFAGASRVFSGDDDADPASASPGPEHAHLKDYTGTWEAAGTMPAPGGAVAVKAQQTGEMIMAGRFLKLESEISVGDMKVRMLDLVGYDPAKKKFVHVSVEDDSSRIGADEGVRDEEKKITTMRGIEVTGPGKEKKYHFTITDVADGAFTTAYFTDDGGEKKVMELTYKKK